ncbi:methyltransferase domain-containing protein [Streptomyces sp. NPDC058734]|uniref:methyltransferase domain-containing protein n=1 Tax=Streptomyces sp. NPDC058734 TaxID=3346615 RepID=UPI0036A70CDD
MTTTAHQERPGRTELGRCLMESGALTSDWAPAFAAVDRAHFLPRLMWPFLPADRPPSGAPGTASAQAVDRNTDPVAWYGYADRDLSIVTQWDDGAHQGAAPGTMATSSSSQPSLVYRLLASLDLDAGMRVLDAGTGTGETAGLLAHRCGAENVTTIDVDPTVAKTASDRLTALGTAPRTVTGDALAGHPGTSPYDRILCTFGVRSISRAWLEQVRPGGVIVAPYGTHYSNRDAILRLTVAADGTASGRFTTGVEFMKARSQRTRWPAHTDYVTSWPAPTGTAVQPGQLADPDVEFTIGLAVPGVTHTLFVEADGTRAAWFYSLTDRSWAAVRWPQPDGPGAVYQHGPRRLWDAVEAACLWWEEAGRPALNRFGLTITPSGEAPWLDDPGNPLPGATWR